MSASGRRGELVRRRRQDGQPIVAGTGCRWRRSCTRATRRRSTSGWPSWRCRASTARRWSRSSPTAPSGAARRTMPPVPAAGCALEKLGIKTLDDFVARHAEISFASSPVRLRGRGTETLTAESLSSSPRPGPARSTGSGRAACCASCGTASAARARAARRRREAGDDAGVHPGAPAARRQHRHGGARHRQLRPRRAAPGRPARRLAEREGAHCRLRRQLHRRRGAGLPHARRRRLAASTGCARPPRASAISPSPC